MFRDLRGNPSMSYLRVLMEWLPIYAVLRNAHNNQSVVDSLQGYLDAGVIHQLICNTSWTGVGMESADITRGFYAIGEAMTDL